MTDLCRCQTLGCLWLLFGLPPAPAAEPPLLRETFATGLPADWWFEGSQAVTVRDGWLVQDANPDGSGETSAHSVVWLGQEFSGDLRFEADVRVASATGDVNDIVLFCLFSDPTGHPLHETRTARASGRQNLYTDTLHGYALFYWGREGVTRPANIRLRDCPGGHLLTERDDYEILTGRTYHLAVEKIGPRVRLLVDDRLLLEHDTSRDEVANPDHTRGWFGLKTWNTELWWDNIQVTRPTG